MTSEGEPTSDESTPPRGPCSNHECDTCHPEPRFRVSQSRVQHLTHARRIKAPSAAEARRIYDEGVAWPSSYDDESGEVVSEGPVEVVQEEPRERLTSDCHHELGEIAAPAPAPCPAPGFFEIAASVIQELDEATTRVELDHRWPELAGLGWVMRMAVVELQEAEQRARRRATGGDGDDVVLFGPAFSCPEGHALSGAVFRTRDLGCTAGRAALSERGGLRFEPGPWVPQDAAAVGVLSWRIHAWGECATCRSAADRGVAVWPAVEFEVRMQYDTVTYVHRSSDGRAVVDDADRGEG